MNLYTSVTQKGFLMRNLGTDEKNKIFFWNFSIFYWISSCPRCEREDQASFTTALSRGEVIPFGTEPSGKRNRAEEILRLLH